MRKNWKRILAMLLAASIVFGDAAPIYATESAEVVMEAAPEEEQILVEEDAEEVSEEVLKEISEEASEEISEEVLEESEEYQLVQPVSKVHINPLYEDIVSEDAILGSYGAVMMAEEADESNIEYHTTIEAAAKELRSQWINRNGVITFGYTYQGDFSNGLDSDQAMEFVYQIYQETLKHTGNPKEGDYLRWQYGGIEYGIMGGTYNDTTAKLIFFYIPAYYTTAEQESKVDREINRLLNDLKGSSDYETIKNVYDYLCDNITYDYDNLGNSSYLLKHTAYAALINKTSVCQGYALLLYRLMLELGIDSRIVSGWANEAHAWNIVELDGQYYNADATWDAGRQRYSYFLKSMDDFTDHIRDVEYSDASFTSKYTMTKTSYVPTVDYKGTVERTENGDRVLYVRHWEVENEGGVFDDAAILKALNARIAAGDSFEQVIICYPNAPKIVNKDVWNAVKALMNNKEWSAGFLFNGGNYMDKNWYIADMKTADKDVVLDGTLQIGAAGQYGKVTFANTDIPAEYAHIRFTTSHWNDGTPQGTGGRWDYGQFVSAFGTEYVGLDLYVNGNVVKDTSVRYEYYSEGPGNDMLDLCVDHVNDLDAKVTYTLKKKIYTGERDQWPDGTTVYRIQRWGFESAGEKFTEDAVLKLLQNEAATGTKYDRVELVYPSGTTQVAMNVWNAAVALLSNAQNRGIAVVIERSSSKPLQEWSFNHPKKATANITCEVDFLAGNSGKYGTISFKKLNQPSDNLCVRFNTDSEDSYFVNYENAFGTKTYDMNLVNPDGTVMNDSTGNYDYRVEDWGRGINVTIWNAYNLKAGVTYSLEERVYRGNVNSWTDDNGKVYTDLEISPNSANQLSFTNTEVIDILNYHAGKGYNSILIEQRQPVQRICADVVNAALSCLAAPSDGMPAELRFGFWDETTGVYYQWVLINPTYQYSDQTISLNYTANQGQNPTIQVGSTHFNADNVHIQLNVHADNGLNYYQNTIKALGNDDGHVMVKGSGCNAWYGHDDWSAWINISEVPYMEANKMYEIAPLSYPVDTTIGYQLSDLTVDPGSYHVKMNFDSNKLVTHYELGMIYSADENLANTMYPGVTFLTNSQIDDGNAQFAHFADSNQTDLSSGYRNEMIFEGVDGLEPNTTYYYRIVCGYYNYETDKYGYYFLTEPMSFTTAAPVAKTKVAIKNAAVSERGYANAEVTFDLYNPDDEYVELLGFNYVDANGEERTTEVWNSSEDGYSCNYIDISGGKVTGNVVARVYVGDKVEKLVKSPDITIEKRAFSANAMDVQVTGLAGRAVFDVVTDPYYDCDELCIVVKYREKGTTTWMQDEFWIYHSEADHAISDLKSGTTYEYYWALHAGSPEGIILTTSGSAEKPMEVTTKTVVVYDDSQFPDEAFRNYLKYCLSIPVNEPLTSADLETLEMIDIFQGSTNTPIKSIEGIQYCTNVTYFSIYGQELSDAKVLEGMTKLRDITIADNELTEMPDFSKMKRLEMLSLTGNLIKEESITADKLPSHFLKDHPDWLEWTMETQRKPFYLTLADTYYAIGDTHPFIVQLHEVVDGRDYTISVEINGVTSSVTAYGYEDAIIAIEDLGNSVSLGKQTVKITVTDETGKVWMQDESFTVTFAGDEAHTKEMYVSPADDYFNFDAAVTGHLENAKGIDIKLLNQKNEVVGTASVTDSWRDYEEDRYEGVFDGDSVPVSRPVTYVDAWMNLADYLSPGDYSVQITMNNEVSLLKDVIHVTDTAVVEYIYKDNSYGGQKDYIYFGVDAINADFDKIWPVVYDLESGTVLSEVVEYKKQDDETAVYKLKKLHQDTYWQPYEEFGVKIQAVAGYDYIDRTDHSGVWVEDGLEVLFRNYNYKKGAFEVQFNEFMKNGTAVKVDVYPYWPYEDEGVKPEATGNGTVKDGKLSVALKDKSGAAYAPEMYTEKVFGYTFINKFGDEAIYYDKAFVEWYNYSEYYYGNTDVLWDNQECYEVNAKELLVKAYVLNTAVSKGKALEANVITPDGQFVGSSTTLKQGKLVTIDGEKYYEYSGNLKGNVGSLEVGMYYVDITDNYSLSSVEQLFVIDNAKFYMDQQYAHREDDAVYLEIYSRQLSYNYWKNYGEAGISADKALKLWNENYNMEIFDGTGRKLTGWNAESAFYEGGFMTVCIKGLPKDQIGFYFRVTDKNGNLGASMFAEEPYYTYDGIGTEKLGGWCRLTGNDGVYLESDDYDAHAFYGLYVNSLDSYPVTVKISLPYDTKVIKSFTVSGNGKNYYEFTKADLVGTVSDEVYDITVITSNGKTISKRGYLASIKEEEKVIEVSGVTLSAAALSMIPGETTVLSATVLPANATNKAVVWESSDVTVASVDMNGTVTAVGAGKATITATAHNGKKASCTVSVYEYSISETALTFDMALDSGAKTLKVTDGVTASLTAAWSSSDVSVATVDKTGKVTPVGVGEAVITAQIKNGPVLNCMVTVTNDYIEKVTLSANEANLRTGETLELQAYMTPANTTLDKNVVWSSSNPAVVTVDANGVVTAVGSGTVIITAASASVPAVKDVCEVTVVKVISNEAIEAIKANADVAIVIDSKTTLKDVDLSGIELPNVSGKLSWKNPEIKLSQFAGMQEKSFIAIYEETDAEPVEIEVSVALTTVSKMAVSEVTGKTMILLGEDSTAQLVVEWTATGATEILKEAAYKPVWTSKTPTVATVDADGAVTAIGAGNATIEAVAAVGGKTYKASYKLKVVDGSKANINIDSVENFTEEETDAYSANLEVKTGKIKVTVENAAKLTVKSSNASVVKAKTSSVKIAEDGLAEIEVTLVAGGTSKITLTADDALKTSKDIYLTVKDAKPSIDVTSLTINTLKSDMAEFYIYSADGFDVSGEPVLGGKDLDKFELDRIDGTDNYQLSVKEGVKAGSYKVEVTVTADEMDYTFPVSVKVAATKAKVTAKQSVKANVFYTDETGYGVLNLTSTENITDVELVDCDFEVVSYDAEQKTAMIKATNLAAGTKADKAGVLELTLDGWKEIHAMNYTVALESKAPKLVLVNKSAVFYPAMGIEEATLPMTMNGKAYEIPSDAIIEFTDAKGKEVPGYSEDIRDGQLVISALDGAKNGSAKVSVQEANWNNAIVLSCSLKINTKQPALKLSKTTVQLNAHADTVAYDMTSTQVMWKDATEFTPQEITVAAADKKEQAILGKDILLEVQDDNVIARLNNNVMKAGSYKFKVNVKASENYTASTTFTVKVVNTAANKAVKLTSKGSIDVLNRVGSYVTVTPKLNAINGTIVDAALSGRSAHLFDAEFVDGLVQIRAKEDANLIVKYAYGVNVELAIENEDGAMKVIKSDEMKLTLKQGSAKVTASPAAKTFYSSAYDKSVDIDFGATLSGAANPVIKKVELTNFKNAFTFDEETGTLEMQNNGEAVKGKSYTLQFNVTLEGHADNVKPIVVKYKVTVK